MNIKARGAAVLTGVLALGGAFLPSGAGAESLARQKKKELQSVRREIDEKRREIQRFRRQEETLSRELAGLKVEASASRAKRARLLTQLRKSESRRRELERKERGMRRAAETLGQGVSDQLLQYDAVHSISSPYYGSDDLWAQALIERSVPQDAVYLERLRGFETAAGTQARDMLAQHETLRRESRTSAKGDKDGLLEEKARALQETRASRDRAAARVRELEESAGALSRLIENIGRRPASKKPRASEALARHSLPWPVKGTVASGYGRKQIPELRTWTVQHGLELRTAPGAEVRSVGSGQVIFAGPFRSYGQVVIIDHGGQLFSLYGRLASSSRTKGEAVAQGEVLGLAGESEGRKGGIYFEIRRRGDPVNPLAWLKRRGTSGDR